MAVSTTFSTTAGAAQNVIQGAQGVASVYTDNRQYSLSDLIVWNERRHAKLENALRARAATVIVDDPEPKVIESLETPINFAVTVNSSTTTNDNDTLGISDANARFIQPGDCLEVSGIFCDSDGSNYSTTKFDSGYFQEVVVVQSVVPSGLSSGNAKVIVYRGNGQNPGTATQITTSMKVIHIGNSIVDGGNSPFPVHFEPSHVQNYCQFFSRTWAMTTSETPLNSYGKMSMEQRAAMKRKEFFRLKELSSFRGRKGKVSVSGKDQWLTGGMVEYVSPSGLDGESRLFDFAGPFDLDTFMEKTEIIGRFGSDVRDAFVGGKFLSALWNHFQQSIIFNDEVSRRYGWAVWELDLGHVMLLLHRHPMFTDVSTSAVDYNFDAAIVDLEYLKLMIYIDVMTRDAVQPNNTHRTENEIFCQTGVWRTFQDAHAYFHGITG